MRLLSKIAIFCHRWMGAAFCLLFAWWFISGIFMMYWDFPSVEAEDRLAHAPALDAQRITFSPEEAYASLHRNQPPEAVHLTTFDGRPAYYFSKLGEPRAIVYADNGQVQTGFPPELNLRTASHWSGQPAGAAQAKPVTEVDQWTVQGLFRNSGPLMKYTWPDGQQVYVSEPAGEVVQYTTRSSRLFAYLGAIPHWLYFTPLRKNGLLWSRIVIWSSGAATLAALLGLAAGFLMYSPSKRYRHAGAPTSIPYRGQKRLHMTLGLFFGIVACTWAFSGMLSMDPFPSLDGVAGGDAAGAEASIRIFRALDGGRLHLPDFAAKSPREALLEISSGLKVKQLDWMYFDGKPFYLATEDTRHTRIIPVRGAPKTEFSRDRIIQMIGTAATAANLAEVRVITSYDRYYLDRHQATPLPVVYVRLNDADHTRYYIDPRTAHIVGNYSSSSWMERWLYHGLHSLNFPWLYNYRPAWDIAVLVLMLGGTWLSITSVIMGFQLARRKLKL